MRLAPMIGRPDSRPRVAVAHQAYSLREALACVEAERLGAAIRREPLALFWIEGRHAPARRVRNSPGS